MLPRDRDEPWEVVAHPTLRELVARLPSGTRPVAERTLGSGTAAAAATGGRLPRESEWCAKTKVSLTVDRGISARWFLVESFWEQHGRADVHRLSPELGEQLALDSNTLGPARVGRNFEFGQGPRKRELDWRARLRVERHTLHVAHQVAGRRIEVLAFPLVVVRPDDVPVRAIELGIDVHQRLNVVLSRRHVR